MRPVSLPPDFGGEPLWEELDGATARDLGESAPPRGEEEEVIGIECDEPD
jgi:hypothetical protein